MKKKIIIGVTICAVLSMGIIPASYVYATGNNWSNVIYPEVYIEDINVGGKQFGEAEELIQKKYGESLLNKKIQIEVNDNIYTLDYSKIEARYNIGEVVNKALSYGKQGNMIQKYKLIKGEEKKEFKLNFEYNSTPIDELIDRIEQQANKDPQNAKIFITKGDIKITPEIDGVKLQRNKLKGAILENINGELSKEGTKIKASLEIIKPEINKEKLASINSPISSFSTSFFTSSANRINNIDLATKAINGTVLMPGESFSFNEAVGERTRVRGYKEAGVIIGDRIESGLGGGICQVSSTLYNTMLNANIKADERRNHSLPLAYIGKGLDATVDWGNIDLKFTNTLNTPIYIEGYIENKNVYFNIYSSKTLTKRTYEMVTDISTIQPTIKYIDDATRLEGEKIVTKSATSGYKVKVYRKTFEGGKLINTELISNDYYTPVNGEVIRGIKKPL
ncbi:VanW family protein [Clostridium malenominatum]|uniref:VanW family protein n=1 Tax=Clostridium malenominatum TaxID=1539 RepID=A0ABN1IUK0_9CLOT